MSHTKEPWACNDGEVEGSNGATIFSMSGWRNKAINNADARRIVACVNALEGYSTEIIENTENIAMLTPDLAEKLMNTERQRDELLAVLRRVVRWNQKYPSSRVYSHHSITKIVSEMDEINKDANDVIAKTKGGAA